MSTVPVFDPQGNLGDIPAERLPDAIKAGGKPGVNMIAPDGSKGVVPADQYVNAVKQGGKVEPFEQQDVKHPGFWTAFYNDVAGAVKGAAKIATSYDPASAIGDVAAQAITNAPDEWKQRRQAGYSLPYRMAAPVAEAVGVNVPGMEQSAREGDVAGVAGHTAAPLATMAATEGLAHGAPVVARAAAPHVAPVVRATGNLIEAATTPEVVGRTVGGAAGATVGHVVGHPMIGAGIGEELGGAVGRNLGKKPLIQAPGLKNYGIDATGENVAFAGESEPPATVEPKYPGANIPAVPDEALLQAHVLEKGGKPLPEASDALGKLPVKASAPAGSEALARPGAAPAEASEALGRIPVSNATPEPPAPAAAPAAAPQPVRPAAVGKALETALGGSELKPNVPLREQLPNAPKVPLPDGFTPVENSSVLKGYRYDPETQEFDAITNTGQRYRAGEVTPEQFQKFEAADSKGQAWNQLRSNATPLGKYVGNQYKPYQRAGLRSATPERTVVIDPQTGAPEFSDVIAARQAGGSAPEATAAPAAREVSAGEPAAQPGAPVMTSIEPEKLTSRWGLDAQSLEDTDANVRGMTPKQSQAYISQLADAYRKGQPVEPVLETRDAQNNVISVDGRHRAMAAQKAGVERIPIIVRRLPAQQ